jgi:hypothetical protein
MILIRAAFALWRCLSGRRRVSVILSWARACCARVTRRLVQPHDAICPRLEP